MEFVEKREFSDKKRKDLADKGHALPDGSFPIENTTDLHNAIQAIGRANDYAKAKAHIISRARALGATKMLPEEWKIKKFVDEIKDAFEKAIGTSSSANQEADERSVENYVRQGANVNTRLDYNTGTSLDNIGGSIVSNTTEPDPSGNIAVQKDLPNATRPETPAIVSQETRPEGDVSPSVAPNNDSLADVSTGGAGVYKAEDGKCPHCGQAMPVKKAENCPDCGKDMKLCNCSGMSKAESTDKDKEEDKVEKADKESAAEDKDETAEDEKTEVKKSLWGGAFAPVSLK